MTRKPPAVVEKPEDSREIEAQELNHLWDREATHSLVNLLPQALGRRFEDARFQSPELFDLAEDELEKQMNRRPTATENQLRLRLWYEMETARANNLTEISVARVCAGVCSVSAFYKYAEKAESIAWLSCMPMSYETSLEELLNHGAAWARKVLAMNPEEPSGKLNTKLMKLQFDIYMDAQMRMMGGYTQKQISANVPTGGAGRVGAAKSEAIEAEGVRVLDKQVRELANQQKRLINPNPGGPKPILRPEDV